jgi:ABC-type branched-subunit amino acid transport system substrate-binding protein
LTKTTITRRGFVAAGAAALSAPIVLRHARGDTPFKIGLFYAASGPASLFGPTQKASAELAVEQINKAGGIMGRQVELLFADAGGPPAESTKAAVRLMLQDKCDVFVGSHDSATREALVATIKGRVPYIYTPVYEGGECSFNTYVLADTPEQQVHPTINYLTKQKGVKTVYLIGNDYVWPRKTNDHVKRYLKANGGKVIGEEYVPLGAPNKFEEAVTRIKGAKPDAVVITVIGADNVNFNRTFAGFGLQKTILRASMLLEENTLLGIGAENSANLFNCMSYFSTVDTPANKAFKAAYHAKFGAKAPQLGIIGVDCYAGMNCAKALVEKAKGTDAHALMKASEGLTFETAAGPVVMHHRHLDKTMYLAECEGVTFKVLKTFPNIASGETCTIG